MSESSAETVVFIHGLWMTPRISQYPGKTHSIAGQPGWEEIADHALEWAGAHHAAPKAMA
jgi:hypothetical protein